MREWPPISEPELLERLALGDEEFAALTHKLAAAWGRREFQRDLFKRALRYPWDRPAGSFLLRDGEYELLEDLPPGEREATVRAFTRDRYPLLSFGGNAAPEWLTAKFAHFDDAEDRTILVLTGDLHGVDVGVAPNPTPIGYLPGALFASEDTSIRAAVVWGTTAQVTQLTWSEVSYRLGRLDDAHFAMDEAYVEVDEIFAFIHRLGALQLDGAPAALAAIPAANRTARALTQEQLLDAVAPLLLERDAGAEELGRAVFDDMALVVRRASEVLWPTAQQMTASWTPLPGTGGTASGTGSKASEPGSLP